MFLSKTINGVLKFLTIIFEISMLPFVILFTFLSRLKQKNIDVGLGPIPMINNVYHKKALQQFGYKAETFAISSYFITDKFDILLIKPEHIKLKYLNLFISYFGSFYLYFRAITNYKIIYIYFDGGPLFKTILFSKIEHLLYKIARIKILVMPYGGDIQDLSFSTNLQFKNALCKDYSKFQIEHKDKNRSNISKWTKYADFVLSGCDWVYYMHHWDKLMLAHFSIDTTKIKPIKIKSKIDNEITILHAPNHKNIKGSQHFIDAVNSLKKDGYKINLKLLQKVSNNKILEEMQKADIIADQLVIGWYAMTALEAMCLEKPVLCYIDPKLKELYESEGLLQKNELPIVNCNFNNVKETIKWLIDNPQEMINIGKQGRKFTEKHHSIEAI